MHAAKCRAACKGMIKMWSDAAGMATLPHHCQHSSPSLHTHTNTHPPSLVWLHRLLTHAPGSWLPATRLLLKLSFPGTGSPAGRQAEFCEGLVRQAEHGSAGPVWIQPSSNWEPVASNNNNNIDSAFCIMVEYVFIFTLRPDRSQGLDSGWLPNGKVNSVIHLALLGSLPKHASTESHHFTRFWIHHC